MCSVLVAAPMYPPSLPRSVRATRTNSAVQVTWSAPTTVAYTCESTGYYYCGPATSYVVSWAPVGSAWQSVTTTGTSRTLSGLQAATTYYVNVRAVNAVGRSGAIAERPGRGAGPAEPGVDAGDAGGPSGHAALDGTGQQWIADHQVSDPAPRRHFHHVGAFRSLACARDGHALRS